MSIQLVLLIANFLCMFNIEYIDTSCIHACRQWQKRALTGLGMIGKEEGEKLKIEKTKIGQKKTFKNSLDSLFHLRDKKS